MPNVVIISHASPRYNKGGGELAAYREYRILRRHGLDCLFAGAMHGENGASLPTVEWITPSEIVFHVSDYDERFEVWGDNRGAAELLECVERHEPDVVHLHHYWRIGLNTIIALRRRLPCARFVLTLHEMLAICMNSGQMIKTNRDLCMRYDRLDCHRCFSDRTAQAIERRRHSYLAVFQLIDNFIYPSEFVRGRYEAWGLSVAKGITLENALDFREPRMSNRAEMQVSEGAGPRKFAFFGAATAFKGLDILVKATAVAASRSPDFVVYVHGVARKRVEELFPNLKPTIESLGETLCFMGQYEASEIYGLMSRCDWMIVPSIWWENSPMVIQEALAARLPMIVSNIGGMAEKVRPGVDGLHFQAGDHLDLAEKIQSVATKVLSAEMKESMSAPISDNCFLHGLEAAFGIPLRIGSVSPAVVDLEREPRLPTALISAVA